MLISIIDVMIKIFLYVNSVTAADLFGDGWGPAKLLLYSSYKGQTSFAPNCLHNPITIDYCFDDNSVYGDYIIIKVVGFQPNNAWEVNKLMLVFVFPYDFRMFDRDLCT